MPRRVRLVQHLQTSLHGLRVVCHPVANGMASRLQVQCLGFCDAAQKKRHQHYSNKPHFVVPGWIHGFAASGGPYAAALQQQRLCLSNGRGFKNAGGLFRHLVIFH